MIFVDVIGRTIFSTPFPGAIEIIKNSVVSITFLQIPLAIYSDRMLHTTLLYGAVGAGLQKLMRSMAGLLGCVFFLALAYSSWTPSIEALAVGEYEGEGALRVPTYPVRFLVVLTSILSALIYLYLLVLDWTGALETKQSGAALPPIAH